VIVVTLLLQMLVGLGVSSEHDEQVASTLRTFCTGAIFAHILLAIAISLVNRNTGYNNRVIASTPQKNNKQTKKKGGGKKVSIIRKNVKKSSDITRHERLDTA
jgi:hypothetical protein